MWKRNKVNALQNKSSKIVVIGIGNIFRLDDQAGIVVAKEIAKKQIPDVIVTEQSGEGTALMEAWKDAEAAIIIDAVCSNNLPGTIHRFDADELKIPFNFFNYSTHAFSVAEAVELSKALKLKTPRLIVYGIDGRNFGIGERLSEEVRSKVQDLVLMILTDIMKIRFLEKEEHACIPIH
jgi:hydrogenase maturation protease